jgi:tetrahydromethanopterin S-methyltransferase subunit G
MRTKQQRQQRKDDIDFDKIFENTIYAPKVENKTPRHIEILGGMVVAMFMAMLFTWVAINWVVGCGEIIRTTDGLVLYGECVLMPWRN